MANAVVARIAARYRALRRTWRGDETVDEPHAEDTDIEIDRLRHVVRVEREMMHPAQSQRRVRRGSPLHRVRHGFLLGFARNSQMTSDLAWTFSPFRPSGNPDPGCGPLLARAQPCWPSARPAKR